MGKQRPTTRSKNKRSRVDDNAVTTSEIFRKILANGEVTEDDINQLYMIWKPVCHGCRVNSKDNPNCFCGLIPPPNGSRKSGLWQKTSEIIYSLGPNPSIDLRASPGTPAGLTNLGATCYANSILQCLYMNKSFRQGVLSLDPEVLEGEPVLNNLARLFAQLHSSKMAFVDSAPFIETLELDNGVQQDSHEFLTLLFSLLERCLSRSKTPKAITIVHNLFRGGVSHVTRCSKCGNESEASSKIEDFYELELNVKGLKSLDESLDDYLSIEKLQGDNQYFCQACAMRADATRRIKLRSLPAVLNFQLKRCVFLPNTTTKKKITSAFCFPQELNMAPRLSGCQQTDLIYDLAAVLIHKGSAVNSGHYTAHIKDDNTGLWWEFDDEHVSNLGRQPFGSSPSTSGAKAGQNEPADCSVLSKEVDVPVNGNHVCASETHISELKGANHLQTFSSNDAYMLMYVLRHSSFGGEKSKDDKCKMEIESSTISQTLDSALPTHLLKEVELSNAVYLTSCEEYESKKEAEMSCIMKRRQEVRSVLSEAPVLSIEKHYYWVSTEWLRQWADNVTSSAIDNTSIQCLHGKVPVSRINNMKRLSTEAWTDLFSKYGGGPTLSKGDHCNDCIFEMGSKMRRANIYRDQRLLMKELAEAALSGEPLDGELFFISKSWLQQWHRRKNIDLPCDADSGPTASIRCIHGELLPEDAPGAKRLLVPKSLWDFIHQTAITVKPDDHVGCSSFPSDSEQCALCSVAFKEAAFSEGNLRDLRLKQKQNHEKLAMNKAIALHPDTKYYILPSYWLSKWRSYINASGKSACSVELDILNTVIDKLLCEKHCKLVERPPELLWKRELVFQKSVATDGLTLILEDDWRLLCEEWGGTVSKCISAEIEIGNCMGDNMKGSYEEMQLSEDHMSTPDDVNMSLSRRPIIKTSPQVCEECIGERESTELMKKLNYFNEDICVCLVRGKEPPKSILEASCSISDPSRRTSKRSRKASYGNSANMKVSASTSIYQLKMMIWESFGVVKENQILHKGSKILDGETACLADLNIFPGDILWVTDSMIHENRDIADELSDPNLDIQKEEGGFRGTLLTSTIPHQAAVSEACLN
ncbi:ubiquitin carboxyl-terminal hydrolase 26 [Salvia hispanica]|uniref:ubiquitin carboxyl-terminal hydrolase 26 n=1 Tax=Salvia hispanica TaxID=49212 RepID=UPI0020090A55|nr:ubiquitin carboxyl-terminal hydrolase 26 [Salvia hispanica]